MFTPNHQRQNKTTRNHGPTSPLEVQLEEPMWFLPSSCKPPGMTITLTPQRSTSKHGFFNENSSAKVKQIEEHDSRSIYSYGVVSVYDTVLPYPDTPSPPFPPKRMESPSPCRLCSIDVNQVLIKVRMLQEKIIYDAIYSWYNANQLPGISPIEVSEI